MSQFEIYFDDLNSEAQDKYLEWIGIQKAEDGNFEYMPITILDRDDEE